MQHQKETQIFIGITVFVLMFLIWNILFQDNKYEYEIDEEYIEFHNQHYRDQFEDFIPSADNSLLEVSTKKRSVNTTSNKKELECLALNIYHEARNQSRNGKLLVGHVTLNRVESDRYPNSICKVVYQKSQFSWTHLIKNKTPRDKESWQESLDLARLLIKRTFDRSKGSMYYYNPKKVTKTPNWAKKFKRVMIVGDHHFYKKPS